MTDATLTRNYLLTANRDSILTGWRQCVAEGVKNPVLFGHPWGWSQFVQDLRYKCVDAGISLVLGATSCPTPCHVAR